MAKPLSLPVSAANSGVSRASMNEVIRSKCCTSIGGSISCRAIVRPGISGVFSPVSGACRPRAGRVRRNYPVAATGDRLRLGPAAQRPP